MCCISAFRCPSLFVVYILICCLYIFANNLTLHCQPGLEASLHPTLPGYLQLKVLVWVDCFLVPCMIFMFFSCMYTCSFSDIPFFVKFPSNILKSCFASPVTYKAIAQQILAFNVFTPMLDMYLFMYKHAVRAFMSDGSIKVSPYRWLTPNPSICLWVIWLSSRM